MSGRVDNLNRRPLISEKKWSVLPVAILGVDSGSGGSGVSLSGTDSNVNAAIRAARGRSVRGGEKKHEFMGCVGWQRWGGITA